ncbi:uncharacterized protein LOC119658345 isoform X2 [Hermetia illucens]|uniref:uncharacterized protein LOC119658345 isoform X2 n=1 Tax=Hermetia illucens TaxID=343691 RepID=UPI0018CC7035|nr:uncharacterized protein LOC119658345 isoform X2 [Hermetia illucens]
MNPDGEKIVENMTITSNVEEEVMTPLSERANDSDNVPMLPKNRCRTILQPIYQMKCRTCILMGLFILLCGAVVTLVYIYMPSSPTSAHNDYCSFQPYESITEDSKNSSITVAWSGLIRSAKNSIDVLFWEREGEKIVKEMLNNETQRGVSTRTVTSGSNGADHVVLVIVDGSHLYFGGLGVQGSNLGLLARNCPLLAEDALKIFNVFYEVKMANTQTPLAFHVNGKNDSNRFVSMTTLNSSQTNNLDPVLRTISQAKRFIHISTFTKPNSLYWRRIDFALEKTGSESNVSLQWLLPWRDYFQRVENDGRLQNASSSNIQKRWITYHKASPCCADNLNYIVTDNMVYIGTSIDYLGNTVDMGFILGDTVIRKEFESIFQRCWESRFVLE